MARKKRRPNVKRKKTRRFDGKIYRLTGGAVTKENAVKLAKRNRRQGYLARVIKVTEMPNRTCNYRIYTRVPKGAKIDLNKN